jgi:hypothetical protein
VSPSFLIIIILVALVGAGFWYEVCLKKAKAQRALLLVKVDARIALYAAQNPAWKTLLADFNYVSLRQHVMALVFFRDPYKLYPNTIQQLI